jgi:hypothetical protein
MEFASKDALYDHLATIWENSSTQLDRLCSANAIRYFHFLQPNQYVAGSKTMSEEERAVSFVADHPYRNGVERGYPLLIGRGRALAARGVRFHDLTMAFADVPGPIYIDVCCHYNKAGYQILADRVAAAIVGAR